MIKNILNKIFKFRSNQPDYAWIISHSRSTDVVFFGPFYSYKELDQFFNSNPESYRIKSNIQLMITPTCSPSKWWYNSIDQLMQDHPHMFDSLEKVK